MNFFQRLFSPEFKPNPDVPVIMQEGESYAEAEARLKRERRLLKKQEESLESIAREIGRQTEKVDGENNIPTYWLGIKPKILEYIDEIAESDEIERKEVIVNAMALLFVVKGKQREGYKFGVYKEDDDDIIEITNF